MRKVVHITTVHNPFDNRIFHRECKTLAAAGYEVVLLAEHSSDESHENLSIRALPSAGGRLARMSFGVWRAFRMAFAERAELYHFHDPELIPAGLLLRLLPPHTRRTLLRRTLPPRRNDSQLRPLPQIARGPTRRAPPPRAPPPDLYRQCQSLSWRPPSRQPVAPPARCRGLPRRPLRRTPRCRITKRRRSD